VHKVLSGILSANLDIDVKLKHAAEVLHLKLEKELDVVKLIRSIRKLRLLSKIILTKRGRMLMKFSRTNLIESSNSSSDSDDNKYDIVKLKQSKNSLVRLSSAIKIKKSL
jgi:hypothetical protein